MPSVAIPSLGQRLGVADLRGRDRSLVGGHRVGRYEVRCRDLQEGGRPIAEVVAVN